MGGTVQAMPYTRFEAWTQRYWGILAPLLMAMVVFLDIVTGTELSFSFFYLVPLFLVAWHVERRWLVAVAGLCALIWLGADIASGSHYSHPLVYVWNVAFRFAFFLIFAWLLGTLHDELQRARELSRTDYLTGAASAGFFYDLLQLEIDRCNRHGRPFTLAYIDIDNFKLINDRFGHSTGDEVLRQIVASAKGRLRKTDTLARLGGDEWAVLLPETDESAAQVILSDLRNTVLGQMKASGWPVTFSVGAMTFASAPLSSNQAIGLVDQLMYSAKNAGKDSIRHACYPAGVERDPAS